MTTTFKATFGSSFAGRQWRLLRCRSMCRAGSQRTVYGPEQETRIPAEVANNDAICLVCLVAPKLDHTTQIALRGYVQRCLPENDTDAS